MAECCILMQVNFFDELLFEERLDGAVQRSRAQSHTAAGLLSDLPHNGVTVQIVIRKRKQNLKRC